MAVDVAGTIGLVVFYVVISAISYVIAFKRHVIISFWRHIRRVKADNSVTRKQSSCRAILEGEGVTKNEDIETEKVTAGLTQETDFALARRTLGLALGTFTLTAGWIGGGFINGTAEKVYMSGLLATTAPFGCSLSLLVGGLLFGKKMREKNYMTMIDPLQHRYGEKFGAVLMIFALLAEIFWSLAILVALGTSISVILEILPRIAIVAAVSVAVLASIVGGMKFLIYIDTIQLTITLLALWGSLPFFLTQKHVSNIAKAFHRWSGRDKFVSSDLLVLFEEYALLIFGGIPWQTYFQKILTCKNNRVTYQLSFTSCFLCLLVTVPAIIIGAVATCTDWSKFSVSEKHRLHNSSLPRAEFLLPVAMTQLLPPAMVFFTLGSITAAALSSTQSSMLGAASMISHNFFTTFIKPNASDRVLTWCSRFSMIIIGGVAIGFSFLTISVYKLWFFSSDLVYIILFPRLVGAVYVPWTNIYGGVSAIIITLVLRLLLGEELLHIPQLLKLPPLIDGVSLFPGKTCCMILSIFLDIVISKVFFYFFLVKKINLKYDLLGMMLSKDYKDMLSHVNVIKKANHDNPVNIKDHSQTKPEDDKNVYLESNIIINKHKDENEAKYS